MTLAPATNRPPVWGATYAPARAYNAYLHWRDYDPSAATRDVSFAAKVRLDTLRVFLSYEFWVESPEKAWEHFDHLLTAAETKGIRLFPVLFDRVGQEPTPENLRSRDPFAAGRVCSPHPDVVRDPGQWSAPREFVEAFLARYANDPRLAAIDVCNAPAASPDIKFTRAMFPAAASRRGTVPLTVGTPRIEDTRFFLDLAPDVLQFHCNYPPTDTHARTLIAQALDTQEILNKPVWLTEWSRTRPAGDGTPNTPLPGDQWQPAYATLSDTVRTSGLAGALFSSLLVRPAPDLPQRTQGTLTGLFHDDGAVWSLQDARAVSNDLRLFTVERREWPDFAKPIRQAYLDARA